MCMLVAIFWQDFDEYICFFVTRVKIIVICYVYSICLNLFLCYRRFTKFANFLFKLGANILLQEVMLNANVFSGCKHYYRTMAQTLLKLFGNSGSKKKVTIKMIQMSHPFHYKLLTYGMNCMKQIIVK